MLEGYQFERTESKPKCQPIYCDGLTKKYNQLLYL